MPRRRLALTLLGLLHLSVGMSQYLRPLRDINPDLAIFHELFPPWLRVTLWVTVGAATLLCALLAARSDRAERLGWTIVILMPMERAASYGWSGLMWLIPGWPPGAVSSWGTAVLWLMIAALIWLMAGWPEASESRA